MTITKTKSPPSWPSATIAKRSATTMIAGAIHARRGGSS
jgi:hypothetical protein